MKDNNNKQEVIIASEMYEALIRLAEEGAKHIKPTAPPFALSRIKWHARKFNKHLRIARAPQVVIETQILKRDKARARWISENLTNSRKPPSERRSVWVAVSTPSGVNRLNFLKTRVTGVFFNHENNRWEVVVRGDDISGATWVGLDQVYLKLPPGVEKVFDQYFVELPWSRPDGTKP